MTLKEMIDRVRAYTRDTTGSLFTQEDIVAFVNEAIDRTRRYKKLSKMEYLINLYDEPIYLPEQYHHLLALYATSRCFTQDEQLTQAQQFMNEYEFKTSEMEQLIENGELEITPPDSDLDSGEMDGVKNVYFTEVTY